MMFGGYEKEGSFWALVAIAIAALIIAGGK